MTVLLQVSDPHFGTERPAVMAALARFAQALRPDLLLVTGDITQRARPAQFARARAFFDRLDVPARLVVPGNHEFDRRDVDAARDGLRAHVQALGLHLLDDEAAVLADAQGRRVRFVGSTRWCDFDAFGPSGRERAMRAGSYFQKVMQATRHGEPFDAVAVRKLALESRAWLAGELARRGDWDATVAITHFAPSLKSADPRYGRQPGTASFCNDDEALLPAGYAFPLGPQPLAFVGLMLVIGLCSSWLGTLCWNEASQRLPTSLSGQLIVFETLAALAYAFAWSQRMPPPATLAGIALLMAGVVWALRIKPVRHAG